MKFDDHRMSAEVRVKKNWNEWKGINVFLCVSVSGNFWFKKEILRVLSHLEGSNVLHLCCDLIPDPLPIFGSPRHFLKDST